MTIREIKRINRKIGILRSRLERLRTEATNISPKLSDTPRGDSRSDRLGQLIAQIDDTKSEIEQLKTFREAELNRLSRDVYEENCIYIFLTSGCSWLSVAQRVDGRRDTAESIRVRCSKYVW